MPHSKPDRQNLPTQNVRLSQIVALLEGIWFWLRPWVEIRALARGHWSLGGEGLEGGKFSLRSGIGTYIIFTIFAGTIVTLYLWRDDLLEQFEAIPMSQNWFAREHLDFLSANPLKMTTSVENQIAINFQLRMVGIPSSDRTLGPPWPVRASVKSPWRRGRWWPCRQEGSGDHLIQMSLLEHGGDTTTLRYF